MDLVLKSLEPGLGAWVHYLHTEVQQERITEKGTAVLGAGHCFWECYLLTLAGSV